MKLIDIGINLMDAAYDHDRGEVIKSAAGTGVSPLIITASGERKCLEAAIFADNYNAENPGALLVKAGVHPHDAKDWGLPAPGRPEGSLEFFRELIKEKDIAAIGECCLDYNRDFSPRNLQRKCFVKQAELAAEFALPLFLHEREAFADFSIILGEHIKNVPAAVLHCFTGTEYELDYYLSLGCYIGITGWICDERRGRHLRELVKKIPPNRLMLETDGPYLLPRDLPFKVKSRRNESKYLPHIAETAARLLDKDPEKLAAETFENSIRFFGTGRKS